MKKEQEKKALCLKDGFMTSGREFCFKNKYYTFYFVPKASHGYNVKTERQHCCNHSMTEEFFDEYFIETKITETEILPEELFEV